MLTLSEAEHGAYHNGNVSDVHNPQRIYDTLWMQAYPVAPRRDPTADVADRATGHHHRVEDTMMIGASETRRSW